ncbi:hypothetical protein M422DRAFT_129575, partial [Sphaerobolus stellatus SS14]
FLELAVLCKAVVWCTRVRVSPLQKELVKLVNKSSKSILLSIGDGANRMPMIQAAHVGVGISGVEGLQAARSADFTLITTLKPTNTFYKNIVLYMTQFWVRSV